MYVLCTHGVIAPYTPFLVVRGRHYVKVIHTKNKCEHVLLTCGKYDLVLYTYITVVRLRVPRIIMVCIPGVLTPFLQKSAMYNMSVKNE